MSSENRYDNYGNVGDAGPKCSSGRAQSRSWHVTSCQGSKDWRTDIYDREILHGPINFDGRARPLEKRRYKSKWAKRNEKRVPKKKTEGFYGYKKETIKSNWTKYTCSQGGERNGKILFTININQTQLLIINWYQPQNPTLIKRSLKLKLKRKIKMEMKLKLKLKLKSMTMPQFGFKEHIQRIGMTTSPQHLV